MGIQIIINRKNLLKRVWHKLFKCPTFWQIKRAFTCPVCGSKYRCYWDGNDVLGFVNVCSKCFPVMDKIEKLEQASLNHKEV